MSGIPGGDCEGSYCVYCPGGNEEDCQYVEGDEDFCENTVACELKDGSVVFGLSETECNEQSGYCSVDCPGQSCRSWDGFDGVCLAIISSESLCEDLNSFPEVDAVWYQDTICVISSQSQSTCAEVFFFFFFFLPLSFSFLLFPPLSPLFPPLSSSFPPPLLSL